MSVWLGRAKHALLPGLSTGSKKYKDLAMDLSGKVIVFTGTLSLMTRNEARAIAVKLGAILSDTVSGKTDYLIVGDKPGSNKMRDARRWKVQLISEQDWYKLCPKSNLREPIKNTTVNKPMIIPSRLILEVSAPELDLD